jgi:hypothetical protein
MSRLEEIHAMERPLLRARARWFRVALVSVCLLGAFAMLQWSPGAPHIRAALFLLLTGCLFELVLALVLLLNSSAWRKWVNPAAEPRWARRMFWLQAGTSFLLLALILVMARVVGIVG